MKIITFKEIERTSAYDAQIGTAAEIMLAHPEVDKQGSAIIKLSHVLAAISRIGKKPGEDEVNILSIKYENTLNGSARNYLKNLPYHTDIESDFNRPELKELLPFLKESGFSGINLIEINLAKELSLIEIPDNSNQIAYADIADWRGYESKGDVKDQLERILTPNGIFMHD